MAYLFAGVAIGYVAATVLEAWFHKSFSHANQATVDASRCAAVRRYRQRERRFHAIVHHGLTFRWFDRMFDDEEQRRRADRVLAGWGSWGEQVRRADYGARPVGHGWIGFFLPILPIALLLGPWGALGALPMLAAPPLLSAYVHPVIHNGWLDAVAAAPLPVRWLLGTRFGRAIVRNHVKHHLRQDSCFNLLLGGDFLLGTWRPDDDADRAEFARIGIPQD